MLGPQIACRPSLRSPLAQVVDLAERDRERQRLFASWAAFLIRTFPDSDFGGRRAQIVAGALVFPAHPAGRNSGGGDDGPRTSPLLPYVLPGDPPAPMVTFPAEVCAHARAPPPDCRVQLCACSVTAPRARRRCARAVSLSAKSLLAHTQGATCDSRGHTGGTVSCRWPSQRARHRPAYSSSRGS